MNILLIDNYDSFTYNLLHLFAVFDDVEVTIMRNNEDFLSVVDQFDGIIIGPGPGNPTDKDYFGDCMELIKNVSKPTLGVCLGFQGIAVAYGATLKKAKEPKHGKTSNLVFIEQSKLFENVTDLEVMRYHSLMIDTDKPMPEELVITAEVDLTAESVAQNGREIMAIQHKSKPLYGVQFHPESFATPAGHQLAQNFVNIVKQCQGPSLAQTDKDGP